MSLIVFKPKKLKYDDFRAVQEIGEMAHFEYTEGDYKITVEPCMAGFDVKIYRANDLISIEPAKCTEFNNGIDPEGAFKKALFFAQQYYDKYIKK